jgi:hypothetical protein
MGTNLKKLGVASQYLAFRGQGLTLDNRRSWVIYVGLIKARI